MILHGDVEGVAGSVFLNREPSQCIQLSLICHFIGQRVYGRHLAGDLERGIAGYVNWLAGVVFEPDGLGQTG